MEKSKIIESLAKELNVKLPKQEVEILCSILTEKITQNLDFLLQDYQCYCVKKTPQWNFFKLPIDCLYVYRTVERIAFKEEKDKILTKEKDDRIAIRYISKNNPIWTKIRMEIKDYMKKTYLEEDY